tara:strand:+ start:5349 stop:5579 length:231 start_codon:yes stop_codon:yes gene_type:complete
VFLNVAIEKERGVKRAGKEAIRLRNSKNRIFQNLRELTNYRGVSQYIAAAPAAALVEACVTFCFLSCSSFFTSLMG